MKKTISGKDLADIPTTFFIVDICKLGDRNKQTDKFSITEGNIYYTEYFNGTYPYISWKVGEIRKCNSCMDKPSCKIYHKVLYDVMEQCL